MIERFEEIFEEVMEEKNMEWWELYDSSDFDEVENRIVAEFGKDVLDSDEYCDWTNEMTMDL
jgi:hypothetical protein